MTGDLVTPPTTVQDLLTLFPWIASVPERLQQRLLCGSQVAPLTFEKPGQLLLYVGLSDEKSPDSTLAAVHPDLKNHLLPSTFGESLTMTSLRVSSMINSAPMRGMGKFKEQGGNCRTWSILRWFPKPGAPIPVRGRKEPDCWGLPVLQPHEKVR